MGDIDRDSIDPIDLHIGKRLRRVRMLKGISQESLGEANGVSFQQIQKYERAANRISASRLFRMAAIFGVPVAYFFEGFTAGKKTTADSDIFDQYESLKLLHVYYSIQDEKRREQVFDVLKSIAESLS